MTYWGRRTVWESNEEDRLSKLPNSLKEIILDHLPLKEAGRTSILSREWRYIWTGLSKLVFDTRIWNCWRKCHAKHLQRLFSALKGPVREFYMDVVFLKTNVNEDFWFKNLAEKGVEEIEIRSAVYVYKGRGRCFDISRSMFECQKLRKIKLVNNLFIEFPLSKGFPNLVTLELKHVRIGSTFLSTLVSLCPLLETLIVTCAFVNWPERGRDSPLVLSSVSLKTLCLHNLYLGNLSFRNIPELAHLSLSGENGSEHIHGLQTWSSSKFLSSLPPIKQLSFHFSMLEDLRGNCPTYLPTELENLERMVLLGVKIHLCNHVSFALCLMKSAPQLQSLQSLTIHVDHETNDWPESDRALEMLESRTSEDSKFLSNVSKIWIHEMTWCSQSVALIKIILLQCLNLETLFLRARPFLADEFPETIPKELSSFPFYLDKVQIICRKKK